MPEIAGMTFYQICWYFLIYSVIGWMLEVIYHAVALGKVINRGFLNGPVCPVYGFGMLAVFAMINTLGSFGGSLGSNQDTNVWVLFISGTVLASAVELIAGWLLLHLFHARWWDYSDKPFNLGGYICPQFSLLWGIGAVLVVRVFHPGIDQMSAGAIPERIGWPVLGICYGLYIADLIVTVLIVIGLNKKLAELDDLRRRMRIVSNAMSETIAEQAISTTVFVEKQQVQASLAKAELKDMAASARAEARDRAASARAEAASLASSARSSAAATASSMKSTAAAGVSSAKSAVTAGAASAKTAVAAGAASAKTAVAAGASSAKSAVTAGTSSARSAVSAGISSARSAAATHMSEAQSTLVQRSLALKRSLTKHRIFGARRLLKAFPNMRHSKYAEALKELLEDLK